VRDPDGATHLDTTARRMLRLDDAQRVAGIDRDLWIGYGRAHDAHERLERILRSERRMRPDNLLIVGAATTARPPSRAASCPATPCPKTQTLNAHHCRLPSCRRPTARESRCSWRRSCKA